MKDQEARGNTSKTAEVQPAVGSSFVADYATIWSHIRHKNEELCVKGAAIDSLAIKTREAAEERVNQYQKLQQQMVLLGPVKVELETIKYFPLLNIMNSCQYLGLILIFFF